jgi:hypothetical protein
LTRLLVLLPRCVAAALLVGLVVFVCHFRFLDVLFPKRICGLLAYRNDFLENKNRVITWACP